MNRKKPDITQEICDQVKFLIKGGATNRKAGSFVGLSATTVSRIRTADYNAEKYRKNNEIRNAEEKQSLVPDYFTKDAIENVSPEYIEDKEQPGLFNLKLTQHEASEQVPGQMRMFFAQEGKPPVPVIDENKIMRFLTGKTDLLGNWLVTINTTLDKLNDNLCQILRRMDK